MEILVVVEADLGEIVIIKDALSGKVYDTDDDHWITIIED